MLPVIVLSITGGYMVSGQQPWNREVLPVKLWQEKKESIMVQSLQLN